MARHAITARAPRGHAGDLKTLTGDGVAGYLEDAAHYPGGRTPEVVFPRNEAEVAAALRGAACVLPIGAQSSLTGAATPLGDVLLTTARMNAILELRDDRARVEAGVVLGVLIDEIARRGRSYPAATTFSGAFVGGTVATNAAGAATFKYGTTREWVEALTVVLATGDVLDIHRGDTIAHPDGHFDILLPSGSVRVPIPRYRMPNVPKCSAGYYAAPGMDLVDLFIGSEGTLGVITAVDLRTAPLTPTAWLLIPCPSEQSAIALTREIRRTPAVGVCAIENMDRRCLDLLREDGSDRKHAVTIGDGIGTLLLVQTEVPDDPTPDAVFDRIARMRDDRPPDSPLVRLCRLLDAAGLFDDAEIAAPSDSRRIEQFVALREAVPAAVNSRIGRAKSLVDARIHKTAADMIVPFDRFEETMAISRRAFASRGLDYAIWGHMSDGNVHPNVVPRSYEDIEAGRAAILEIGRAVIARGGSPMAEHGVGRNPIKQALLRELYGDEGIEQMRAVKRALDPEWKLSPGVIFPVSSSPSTEATRHEIRARRP